MADTALSRGKAGAQQAGGTRAMVQSKSQSLPSSIVVDIVAREWGQARRAGTSVRASCGFSPPRWWPPPWSEMSLEQEGLELEPGAGWRGCAREVLAGQSEHQALFSMLPLCWGWKQASLCKCFLREESQFPTALW